MPTRKNRPNALTPEKRLHYPWEYRRFFGQSSVYRLSECAIFRIPNTLGHFRVGITIKARGNSVARNHIKRQIREYFRRHTAELGSYDYNVVIPVSKKIGFPYHLTLRECLAKEFNPDRPSPAKGK